jgi:hypothetical protein
MILLSVPLLKPSNCPSISSSNLPLNVISGKEEIFGHKVFGYTIHIAKLHISISAATTINPTKDTGLMVSVLPCDAT